MSKDVEGLDYDIYIKERQFLAKNQLLNYENFEKSILTTSVAILAFSISLLGLVSNYYEGVNLEIINNNIFLLFISWISFTISILLTFAIFIMSAKSFEKAIDDLHDAVDDISALSRENKWKKITNCLYYYVSILFLIGIVFLLLFSAKIFRFL